MNVVLSEPHHTQMLMGMIGDYLQVLTEMKSRFDTEELDEWNRKVNAMADRRSKADLFRRGREYWVKRLTLKHSRSNQAYRISDKHRADVGYCFPYYTRSELCEYLIETLASIMDKAQFVEVALGQTVVELGEKEIAFFTALGSLIKEINEIPE